MKQKSIFSASEFREELAKAPRKKSSKKEEKVQLQVCEYLRKQYPNVIFTCDLASGLKLPIWIGVLHKKMRSSRGLPDLFIAAPKMEEDRITEYPHWKLKYCGLFIEIKKADVRLKNGQIARSDHHNEQAEILARLNQLGFKAAFGCGFDECKAIIDEYLNG